MRMVDICNPTSVYCIKYSLIFKDGIGNSSLVYIVEACTVFMS